MAEHIILGYLVVAAAWVHGYFAYTFIKSGDKRLKWLAIGWAFPSLLLLAGALLSLTFEVGWAEWLMEAGVALYFVRGAVWELRAEARGAWRWVAFSGWALGMALIPWSFFAATGTWLLWVAGLAIAMVFVPTLVRYYQRAKASEDTPATE